MDIPALSYGMAGVQHGMDNMKQAAHDIARAANPDTANPRPVAEALVDLKVSSQQVAASTEVIKAVDEAIGSLFDERA